jgi:protoporphyrinogen oxidase
MIDTTLNVATPSPKGPAVDTGRPASTTIIDGRTIRRAVIIGAGPAGLTAAHEFLTRSGIRPIVLEKSNEIGGIARTINYKGNRIDIGGHRFFSKSDRVMDWWLKILPTEQGAENEFTISYQNQSRAVASTGTGPDPAVEDKVMLVRERKSRIYFLRKFFDYPISLSLTTMRNLGILRMVKIGVSYLHAMAFPIQNEKNLEEFFINRFGKELYRTFFRSYTEKVWGRACDQISAEWGAQRIKGLNILKAITHAARSIFKRSVGLKQKGVETSLIERFLYPKHGPGQLWEEVARQVVEMGGEVRMDQDVVQIHRRGGKIVAVTTRDRNSGMEETIEGDVFFSTMPIKELMRSITPKVEEQVLEVSDGLVYRDFITVGLLVNRLIVKDPSSSQAQALIRDNWIYVQEPDVKVGRLQIFNNWSPYLVADPSKVWLGLEYFCDEGDELWTTSDHAMVALGKDELARIGIIDMADVQDATVIRVPKTYPAYFGTYDRLDEVKDFLAAYDNLFLVGRNGMHKYNNQDHSMLTAMTAVDNILAGRTDQSNIWAVNTEQEYHEEKSSTHAAEVSSNAAAPVG